MAHSVSDYVNTKILVSNLVSINPVFIGALGAPTPDTATIAIFNQKKIGIGRSLLFNSYFIFVKVYRCTAPVYIV
jgi:hypothetical protein